MTQYISSVIRTFHSIWVSTSPLLIGFSSAELKCYACGFQNKNATFSAECPAHFPPDGKDIRVQSCPVDREWCGIALLGKLDAVLLDLWENQSL